MKGGAASATSTANANVSQTQWMSDMKAQRIEALKKDIQSEAQTRAKTAVQDAQEMRKPIDSMMDMGRKVVESLPKIGMVIQGVNKHLDKIKQTVDYDMSM